MLGREVQFLNVLGPIYVTLVPIVAVVRLVQLKNVPPLRLVTLLGIVTLGREVQFLKASIAILVIFEVGVKVMLVRLVQNEKASSGILVKPVPMVNVVIKEYENDRVPIVVTLFGIIMLVNPQASNALLSMVNTLLGMVMLVRLLQLSNA